MRYKCNQCKGEEINDKDIYDEIKMTHENLSKHMVNHGLNKEMTPNDNPEIIGNEAKCMTTECQFLKNQNPDYLK